MSHQNGCSLKIEMQFLSMIQVFLKIQETIKKFFRFSFGTSATCAARWICPTQKWPPKIINRIQNGRTVPHDQSSPTSTGQNVHVLPSTTKFSSFCDVADRLFWSNSAYRTWLCFFLLLPGVSFFFYLVAASLERPYLRRVRERVVHE